MKPSLAAIVSGTSALLVTFTFTFPPALRAAPASTAPQVVTATNDVHAPGDLSTGTKQVIKLFQSGTSPQLLTDYVQASDDHYTVSAEDILYLNKLGLPQDTIHAMLVRDRIAAQQAEVQTEGAGAAAPKQTPTYSDSTTANPQPEGYSENGYPYYYAYPSEGTSEPSSSSPAETDYNTEAFPYYSSYPDEGYATDDSYVDSYYAPWGWGLAVPFGFGFGFNGFNNFNRDFNRHHMHDMHDFNHQFHQDFAHHGSFNHNMPNQPGAVPHQNFGHGRMAFNGGAHGGGGHHR